MRFLVLWAALLSAVLASTLAAAADEAPVLLTVSGKIEKPNRDGVAVFDRAALTALGLHKLRTSTAWTDGVSEFDGVRMCDVLDAVGAAGAVVEARALNDYFVEIPIEDCRKYPVLLAMQQDGRELSVRDHGPLWIVYPRDDFSELDSELMNARWVWQLNELVVR